MVDEPGIGKITGTTQQAEMQIALRVLEAIISGDRPNASDVEALRVYALNGTDRMAADQMACAVIQDILKQRRLVQEPGSAGLANADDSSGA